MDKEQGISQVKSQAPLSETAIQINVVTWFKYNFPEYGDDLIHIANERKTSYNQGKILKKMGVKRGIPDLFLSVPNSYAHGLWLELKAGKGRLSKEQQEFLTRKRLQGYEARVAYSVQEAKDFISCYMNGV